MLKVSPGKTRITIRLDDDVLLWFRNEARAAGGGSYQALINRALRDVIERDESPSLEETLRMVVRDELSKNAAGRRHRPAGKVR